MLKLLLVDDDKDLTALLAETFERSNDYEVLTANSALDAIDLMCDTRFDVVITDLVMPRIGGAQLINYIRSNVLNRNTSIFVYTGAEDLEQFNHTKYSISKLIKKPLPPSELFESVDQEMARSYKNLYTQEVIKMVTGVGTEVINSIFGIKDCEVVAPFIKKAQVSYGDFSSMIPLFGREIYGSIAVSMERGNVERAISNFVGDASDVVRESMIIDYIIEIANQLAGRLKTSLKRSGIHTNIGLAKPYVGAGQQVNHLVAGPVLCVPIMLGEDTCFTEYCFGQLAESERTTSFNVYQPKS